MPSRRLVVGIAAGLSLEEIFERGGQRLVRHRIVDPAGDILHETFRPYAKFGR